jgi:hypothetical protein
MRTRTSHGCSVRISKPFAHLYVVMFFFCRDFSCIFLILYASHVSGLLVVYPH